ncbi:FMN-dependent NADH-azoreductase [Methylophaga sp. OBS1]|uniref:FMN-dependent NADH-azoreductase n=1 Tax=Methylophaga sp. OBS1 TaxID=2991933 RepID=UPI0022516AA2|nr:NAD(P)H-dependent oxidoreductase [Methylophaga sp. OBS1]MCX4191468.1 NAD(P)H-dependent oxidoreductase [Methylophaga sp. OBS1]MCX4191587.1 NAD(P)H-dependent oxidoreductase [Methylophaga sp. OBS1]
MNNSILLINSSSRIQGSVTRDISAQLVQQLQQQTGLSTIERDLADGIAFIDEQWVGANFTDPAERSAQQEAALAESDRLINELKQASHIVIAAPIYNFSVPAVVKAWIDQVARARVTFRYTENGPEGLLKGKKAYLVIASGGVPLGSEVDYASSYLRHVMGFLGIDDVTLVNANDLNRAANDHGDIQQQLAAIAAGEQ